MSKTKISKQVLTTLTIEFFLSEFHISTKLVYNQVINYNLLTSYKWFVGINCKCSISKTFVEDNN